MFLRSFTETASRKITLTVEAQLVLDCPVLGSTERLRCSRISCEDNVHGPRRIPCNIQLVHVQYACCPRGASVL